MQFHLSSDTNDTTGRSSTSITSLLGILVGTSTKVISSSVDNDGSSNDALRADEFDELVGDTALGIALAISLDVAKIAYMADLICWCTVGLAEWVEVGAGRSAAVGVVTELVDVHASLSIGIVASDVPGDGSQS